MFDFGIIRECKSLFALPVVNPKKKNGRDDICVDCLEIAQTHA